MKYKAVFFDLDGTLMDTSEGIFATAVHSMQTVGLAIPEGTDLRKFVGPPLRECFRITFGVQDDEHLDKLYAAYRQQYDIIGRYKAHFYPGIIDLLKELKNRGYKTAITSMKGETLVQEMAQHFEVTELFDQLLGFDTTKDKTSKKAIILDGCKRLGLKPSECVLVGDTAIDADGAKEAGMPCIRVNWGFGFVPGEPGTVSEPMEILEIV